MRSGTNETRLYITAIGRLTSDLRRPPAEGPVWVEPARSAARTGRSAIGASFSFPLAPAEVG
jgi:hypothetical protein